MRILLAYTSKSGLDARCSRLISRTFGVVIGVTIVAEAEVGTCKLLEPVEEFELVETCCDGSDLEEFFDEFNDDLKILLRFAERRVFRDIFIIDSLERIRSRGALIRESYFEMLSNSDESSSEGYNWTRAAIRTQRSLSSDGGIISKFAITYDASKSRLSSRSNN
jgi:hypothetical protein